MTRFRYGAKNGMWSIVTAIRLICRVYSIFSGSIVAFLTANIGNPDDLATILLWLNQASTICNLIEATVWVQQET